jgi:DNA polymerase elongation subunit (family B)
MLEVFAELIEDIDIITAWNGDAFDIPYLIERAKICFGTRKGTSMFCRGGYPAKRREFVNSFGQDTFSYKLIGRHSLDMMELYKKFNPGEKPSFSLNAIVEAELGEQKIAFDGDLGELYRTNPQKFYEYALHDARLLKLLDDKLKIIQLATTVSRMCHVKLTDVTGSVKTNEGILAHFCLQDGVILPDRHSIESEKYPGAVVYDTIEGRHTNIMTIDLNSLYPSVMKTLGCSKENMIIECHGKFDDYISIISKSDDIITATIISSGEEFQMPAYELEQIIRENGYTIAANGVIFDGQSGILARVVQMFLDERKACRAKKAECEKAGDYNGADRYEMQQLVYKIMANSMYGASGNEMFRLYDIRISSAITLTAQIVSKWQAYVANNMIEEVFGE